MHKVHVIGLGVDHKDLTPVISKRIESAEVLVGGDRLPDIFRDHPALKFPISSPLENVIEKINREMQADREIVVLADGDPLFYGIGKRLIDALGREMVVFHPNITTLQVAASRLRIPWHDIQTVSLHGRKDIRPFLTALAGNDRVAVFTDPEFNPAKVADELVLRGVDTFDMHVFEDLGTESEKVGRFELEDAAKRTFSPLNFVIFDRAKQPEISLCLGLDDDLYFHEKGMITKKEIRAAGLSALEIEPDNIVWDLGAGCGSVAIEASILAHKGAVLAVEKDSNRVQQIRDNIRRMGAYGVDVIHGDMPGCMESLPQPDRIFIGGGIGTDNRVLESAVRILKPGGRLVLHLVLMGSLSRARDYLESSGWHFSIIQVQVSRSKSIAGDQRLEALNPVYILGVKKPE